MSQGSTPRRSRAPLRVLVVDDQPLLLEAVLNPLRRDPTTAVVGTARDCPALLARYREHLPDVTVCNVNLPPDLVEATEEIVRLDPGAKVIVLFSVCQPSMVVSCLRAGAVATASTSTTGAGLVAQVHAVADGEYQLDQPTSDLVLGALRGRHPGPPTLPVAGVLSDRERDVLVLVSEGLTNRCIGERLYVSRQTVKTYLDRIYTKLGVSSRAAAVRQGVEQGLIR